VSLTRLLPGICPPTAKSNVGQAPALKISTGPLRATTPQPEYPNGNSRELYIALGNLIPNVLGADRKPRDFLRVLRRTIARSYSGTVRPEHLATWGVSHDSTWKSLENPYLCERSLRKSRSSKFGHAGAAQVAKKDQFWAFNWLRTPRGSWKPTRSAPRKVHTNVIRQQSRSAIMTLNQGRCITIGSKFARGRVGNAFADQQVWGVT
jgi:hypothetical protein